MAKEDRFYRDLEKYYYYLLLVLAAHKYSEQKHFTSAKILYRQCLHHNAYTFFCQDHPSQQLIFQSLHGDCEIYH